MNKDLEAKVKALEKEITLSGETLQSEWEDFASRVVIERDELMVDIQDLIEEIEKWEEENDIEEELESEEAREELEHLLYEAIEDWYPERI